MTNASINEYSVRTILNRIFDDTNNKLKFQINEITLQENQELIVKDFRGFTVFKVDQNGNVYHKGSVIKI